MVKQRLSSLRILKLPCNSRMVCYADDIIEVQLFLSCVSVDI
jgi:hypothetical protein